MGEEAKNAKRDIPRAVLLSLRIQGCFCYFIEYFAANYFLHTGYTLAMAAASGAPMGDMMLMVGTWLFGSYSAGGAFMLVQAITVFLALIGTTLSCLSTGARVTYAMGRDEEVPARTSACCTARRCTPHRAIWTLAIISAVIGIVTVVAATSVDGHDARGAGPEVPRHLVQLRHLHDRAPTPSCPNTLVIVTLVSNFGTFLLYMTDLLDRDRRLPRTPQFHGFKHMVVPVFGLVANLVCMLFYLVGPVLVSGMSWKEPYIALGVAALWGAYGLFYFLRSSKAQGKEILLTGKPVSA